MKKEKVKQSKQKERVVGEPLDDGKPAIHFEHGVSHGRNSSKYDYNGDDFYDEIFALAFNGANNKEIAFAMGLNDKVFIRMYNGKYNGWNKEQNEKYGTRLRNVIGRARAKNTFMVKAKYLEEALGGKKRLVHEVHNKMRVDGQYTDDEVIQSTYAVTQPNMQALATWLYHNDPEYRKIQRGRDIDESDPNSVPQDIEKGIDITSWIDQEVKAKTIQVGKEEKDVASE